MGLNFTGLNFDGILKFNALLKAALRQTFGFMAQKI